MDSLHIARQTLPCHRVASSRRFDTCGLRVGPTTSDIMAGSAKDLHREFFFGLSFDNPGLGNPRFSSNLVSQTCLIPDMARRALAAGVPIRRLGVTGGGVIAVVDERPLRIEDLARRFESWLPDYMVGSS